jgi:hypothetical protein
MSTDVGTLTALNDDYIRSVQAGDVKRFDELPVRIRNLQAHDVDVRLLCDVAIIHARTTYSGADGRPGGGRYTDVWARRNGRWLAVAAHVTRS